MKLEVKKTVQVEAKTLTMFLKVSDRFSAAIRDQDGDIIFEQEDGYVWPFLPGESGGDYLDLKIDIDTGQILNWVPPSQGDIEELMEPVE